MTHTPEITRKRCPFCGVNVPFVQDPSSKFIDSSWIEHPNNGCRIGRKMYVPEWNTRPREEAQAATIVDLLTALERFADRRCRFDMPGLCAKVTNIEKCDRCHARAVIQKAKESR